MKPEGRKNNKTEKSEPLKAQASNSNNLFERIPSKDFRKNTNSADKSLKISSEKPDSGFAETGKDLSETLKAKAFEWLRQHFKEKRYGKVKKLAAFLGLDYDKEKRYLWQLSSESKPYLSFGLRPNCPTSQHNWRAVGYVPSCLDRKQFPEVEQNAMACGWALSKNKNRELIWEKDRYSLGRIRWWTTGQVQIQVRKPYNLGRCKQLAAAAFYANGLILDDNIAFHFLDGIHWYGSDDVWRTPDGRKLPYMKITAYRAIFGDMVLGDLSHPDSVEIKVCPQLIERMSLLQQQTLQILEMAMKSMQQDGKERQQLGEIIKQSTEQTRAFSELMRDLSAPKAPPKTDRMVV